MLYNSNYMIFWKRQNYGNVKNYWLLEVESEIEMNRCSTETTLKLQITFVQSHGITTPRGILNINYGLWVIMIM